MLVTKLLYCSEVDKRLNMGCVSTSFKYIVLLFNLIFFFLGCAIIGVGIYMQVKMAAYFDLLGDITINSATIFIIIGVIITIISFFGCCGAIMENSCMMYTFATLVTLMLLIEVGLTAVILIYKNETREEVIKQMKKGLANYNEDDHQGVTLTWDAMQETYHCCGIEQPSDWESVLAEQKSVPDSCCKIKSDNCGKGAVDSEAIFREGCFTKFAKDVETNVEIAGAVGGVLGAVQLIAILVACCLGRRAASRRYEDYDHSPSAPLYATY